MFSPSQPKTFCLLQNQKDISFFFFFLNVSRFIHPSLHLFVCPWQFHTHVGLTWDLSKHFPTWCLFMCYINSVSPLVEPTWKFQKIEHFNIDQNKCDNYMVNALCCSSNLVEWFLAAVSSFVPFWSKSSDLHWYLNTRWEVIFNWLARYWLKAQTN